MSWSPAPSWRGPSRSSGSAATSPCTRTSSASRATNSWRSCGAGTRSSRCSPSGSTSSSWAQPGPQLKIVANHAVGFDNIDVAACTAAGVLATNTPDVLTETTADTAFALLMAAARRLGEGERLLRGGAPVDLGPTDDAGSGRAPQDDRHRGLRPDRPGRGRAARSGVRHEGLYADAVRLPPDVEAETGAERRRARRAPRESRLRLDPHEPHATTRGTCSDADAFAQMKPTAVLVNTSRGPVVDEAALAEALGDRRDLRGRARRVRARAGGGAAAARARERRRDPAPGFGHRRYAQRDGRACGRERVRGARRRSGRLRC